MKMIKKHQYNYCEIEVVFSISGRLRLRVVNNPNNPKLILNKIKEQTNVERGTYCSTTNTFLFEYDIEKTSLNSIILNFCGLYLKDIGEPSVKVNYRLPNKHAMGYTSFISLGFIFADLALNFMGIGTDTKYRNFIRWCAFGTTIGAIFEHGYKELNENGAFDPEVMSVMYLLNSINKGNVTQDISRYIYSPVIAWLLTFGRHIITKQNRSIIINAVVKDGKIKVVEEESKSFFFNKFVDSCLDVYQNASIKRAMR